MFNPKIAKEITGLTFHACLPILYDASDNAFRFNIILDTDTKVADLITNVLHMLHYEKDNYSYQYYTYWYNTLNDLLVNLPIRHDDQFQLFCNTIDVRYITWDPIPEYLDCSRIILINDTTIDFRKVFNMQQELYKECLKPVADNTPDNNLRFIYYERCNAYFNKIDEDIPNNLYFRLLKFKKNVLK